MYLVVGLPVEMPVRFVREAAALDRSERVDGGNPSSRITLFSLAADDDLGTVSQFALEPPHGVLLGEVRRRLHIAGLGLQLNMLAI